MARGSRVNVLSRREKSLSRHARYLTRGRRVASFMSQQLHQLLDAEHSQQLIYICRRVYSESSGRESHSNLVHLEDAPNMNAIQQCAALLQQHDALHMPIRRLSPSSIREYGRDRLCATFKHCASRADLHVKRRNPDLVRRGLLDLCSLRRDVGLLTRIAHLISATLQSSSASEMLTEVRFHQWREEYIMQLFEHACRNHLF